MTTHIPVLPTLVMLLNIIIKTKADIISLEFQLVLPDDKALRVFLSKIVSKFTEGPKNRPAAFCGAL